MEAIIAKNIFETGGENLAAAIASGDKNYESCWRGFFYIHTVMYP
jgi:hypothetical protein